MPEILTFNQIKNGDIFEGEYNNLASTGNASIEFKMQSQSCGGIAVLYAPNGTGKTSLSDILACESYSEDKNFVAEHNGNPIQANDKKFHVIKDQINRNVIPGDTSDYLIGADIKREYDLKKKIADCFTKVFGDLPRMFKTEYKVTRITALTVRLEKNSYGNDLFHQKDKHQKHKYQSNKTSWVPEKQQKQCPFYFDSIVRKSH